MVKGLLLLSCVTRLKAMVGFALCFICPDTSLFLGLWRKTWPSISIPPGMALLCWMWPCVYNVLHLQSICVPSASTGNTMYWVFIKLWIFVVRALLFIFSEDSETYWVNPKWCLIEIMNETGAFFKCLMCFNGQSPHKYLATWVFSHISVPNGLH